MLFRSPLILFPSAITNSMSVMLLPTVSEAQSLNDTRKISSTITYTLKYCTILGILCTGLFLGFGRNMGDYLFNEATCGSYILTLAWICPFLYLSSTTLSILNGLGKTNLSFGINIFSLAIRIMFTFFFIPLIGIKAYLWGLLFSNLAATLVTFYTLSKISPFSFSIYSCVLIPLIALCISVSFGLYTENLLLSISAFPNVISLFGGLMTSCILFYILLVAFKILPFIDIKKIF